VVENPYWPWYAGLAALCGWLLYGAVGFRNPRLGLPAFALGNGLAYAALGTLPYLYDKWLWMEALVNLPLQVVFAWFIIRRVDDVLAKRPLPPMTTGADVLAALRRGRIVWSYDGLWFLFLAAAAVEQALLVFDGRYRDAPLPAFVIAAIAAVLRFWTKDLPTPLRWEEMLPALVLAALALIDAALIEGGGNMAFVFWNIAALVIAAPVVVKMEAKKRRRRAF